LAEGILASKLPQDNTKLIRQELVWHIDHKPDERSIAVAKKKIISIFQIKRTTPINLILMLLIIFM
jgi:hypothetical protein